jgi:Leucine-rich repeat (LRR) protein
MATFITSKSIGETMNINVETSTGFWKYNHNVSDSSVFGNGYQTIAVANSNGEFTIISCNSDGTINGNITWIDSRENQLTSFDGTGLSSLNHLDLRWNSITSLDMTDLTSLSDLSLGWNLLTSLDVSELTSLTNLYLNNNQLTSFDGVSSCAKVP